MKFNKKVAIALVAVSASVFGLSSLASAGEGGAAGAIAATLDSNGMVTDIAAAGAVGKNDAAAVATSNLGVVSASALGSAGVIELLSDTGTAYLTGSADTALETSQANSIATFTETPIGSVETGF